VIGVTVAFVIGAAAGIVLGILIGSTIQTALHRTRLHTVSARVDRLERLLASHPEFHWPATNGHAPQETDVA